MTATIEIKVVSSPPLRSVLQALQLQCEKATGLKLVTEIAAVADLKRQIDSGDGFDLAILTPELIDALIRDGKIIADSRFNIARSGLGVVVRAGGPRPDVSSVDAFRRALLAAKSVSYASGSAVAEHIKHVFERLGIFEEVKLKSRLQSAGGHIGKAIAGGAAELGLTHIPVILEASGAELAGPFPDELQFYVDLSGGISAASMKPDGSRALMHFLMSPEATAIIKLKGLDRLNP